MKRLYLVFCLFIIRYISNFGMIEAVTNSTESKSLNISKTAPNKIQSIEQQGCIVGPEKFEKSMEIAEDMTVGSNSSSEELASTDPTSSKRLISKNSRKKEKTSERFLTKTKGADNKIPAKRHSYIRRKEARRKKTPMKYNLVTTGRSPERRLWNRNNLHNRRKSKYKWKNEDKCLHYPKSRGCLHLSKVLDLPNIRRQKMFHKSPTDPNLKSRVRRSAMSSREKEDTADKNPPPEYETMYEDYEDYEVFAYTSMSQPTTSKPMTLFGIEIYDDTEPVMARDEYLLFGSPALDLNSEAEDRLNEATKIMSLERRRLEQLAEDDEETKRGEGEERGEVNADIGQTSSPALDVPGYLEYYEEYDYYDTDYERTTFKTRPKPEESMEEVYFLQTSPRMTFAPIMSLPDAPAIEKPAPKVKTTRSPLSNSTRLKRVLKNRASGKVRKTKTTSAAATLTISTTTLPTAIPGDAYYDSNYDDQSYDDEYYEDYGLDPLVDEDFKNFTEQAKMNRTFEKMNDYPTSTMSTSSGSLNDSTSVDKATTTVGRGTRPSPRVLRRLTSKPTPKPSENVGPWRKRPVYASYYDDLDGLSYNWNYDSDDSIRDYYDYVYENNETSNLDIGWFSKLEDNNDTLMEILKGVELLEDPESELLAKLEDGEEQTTETINSSNAHVLERRPYKRVTKQVCYLTGGIASEMFMRVDTGRKSIRHFQDLTCTHLVIGMGRVVDNTLRLPSWTVSKQRKDINKITTLIKKANIDLKILLAVGESKECPSYVFKSWGDTDPRQAFVESAIELLRGIDFDGLEYHFIRHDMTDQDFKILADLIRETYILFKSNAINLRLSKLSVSLAVPKYLRKKLTNKASEYNLRELYKYLDFTNLISTDLNDGNDIKEHEPPFVSSLETANFRTKHLVGQDLDSFSSLKILSANKGRGKAPPFRPCPIARQPGLIAYNQIFQFIGYSPPLKRDDKPASSFFTDGRTWMSFEGLMEQLQNPTKNSTSEGFTIWGVTFARNESIDEVPRLPAGFGNMTLWKVTKVNGTEL